MAKFVAVFLLALIAISMLQTLVVASHGRGGHHNNNKNKYGPGSLKSFQCPSQCTRRCSKTQYHKPCMFFCQKCCKKCLCVPPGYYGNKAVCPCYNNWKTKEGGPKCPWTIINFPSLVSFYYIICIKCYALGIALTIYYMFGKLWFRRGKMDLCCRRSIAQEVSP